jgi:very-short-patch-repair endonuclease
VDIGSRHYYLDFAYPHVKLGIEAHSMRWHLGLSKVTSDLDRDRRLTADGWTLLYYPFDDLRVRPDYVAAEVLDVRRSLETRLF